MNLCSFKTLFLYQRNIIQTMKVAIPALNENIGSAMEDRFKPCPFFCLYNLETKQIEFKENSMKNGSGGLGPQLVEFLANMGLNKVFAMEIGPKAKEMLDKLKMKTQVVNKLYVK